MKKILLKLSSDEYRRLKWIADTLGLSVSQCIRSFIPSVALPEARIIGENKIAEAKFDDLVPVRRLSEKDKKRLQEYLSDLRKKNWAVTLAKEVKQQVLDGEGRHLTVNTYKRLGRWISPYRWTGREQYVRPRAKGISRLLFGRNIDRFD